MLLSGNPMQHQIKTFEVAKDLGEYGLFWDPGVGKTYEAIQLLRYKFNLVKRYLRTIIFCPPVVVTQWKSEFAKFSNMDQKRIVLLKGTGAQRLKTFLKNAFDDATGEELGCIFVTNYESLLMPDLFAMMFKWAPEALIWDEAHRLKNPSAKRTKAAIKLSDQAHLKYILTGSPILNSPLDLFSQFEVLDGGKTFGRNFFAYRARFMVDRNASMPRDRYFPKWEIRPGALEEINRLIASKTSVVRKQDAVDLPPLVKEVVKVEMTPSQRKLYESMKQDLIAFMGDQACVATMALTKALRLMQIASGYVKLVDGVEVAMDDNPKVEALRDILEDIAPYHKVIVWSVFRANYAQIRGVCDKLGLKYVELHGEVSEKKRQENIDAFRGDESVRVLIGHPGSGGIGVTLLEASYMVYFSRSFSLEHELQSEARNYRKGSIIHEKVTRIDLVCGNSIEELVAEKLSTKEEISFKVLQEVKGRL